MFDGPGFCKRGWIRVDRPPCNPVSVWNNLFRDALACESAGLPAASINDLGAIQAAEFETLGKALCCALLKQIAVCRTAAVYNCRATADFAVAAFNVDTARLNRPKAFFDETGAKNLTYAHNQAAILQTLKQPGKVLGLPTAILIGKDGCELSTMAGPAQWDSQDAVALLSAIGG